MSLTDEIRAACAQVAARARFVRIEEGAIEAYAAGLGEPPAPDPAAALLEGPAEERAAFAVQLDAINFGSGWFPTLRKRPGRSGYYTVAIGLREHGPWTAAQLTELSAADLATVTGQDAGHELMALFAASLNDLGARVLDECDGEFARLVQDARGSAVALAERLSRWDCFADVSSYGGLRVPFFKRAQITAADLALAGVATWRDESSLTLFADNLIPHVLRLDGVLRVDPELAARIEREELLEHGSPEEIELRACALHAVELLSAACGRSAAQIDQVLWHRGGGARYKAVPRHRARCTAY